MLEPPNYKFCPFCATLLARHIDQDFLERKSCPKCEWVYYPHAAFSVAGVIREHGEVLLVQRAAEPFIGSWMFPSGFVNFGEHPRTAVCREVLEETGLVVSDGEIIYMEISRDDYREPGHIAMFFATQLLGGDVRNRDSENLSVRWFAIAEIPEIKLEHHKAVADLVRKMSG